MYLYSRHGRPRGRVRRRRACCAPASVLWERPDRASASMSPAASARRQHNEGFTDRLRPAQRDAPTPRPAPRSGWSSGRSRMLRRSSSTARYADVLEQALYNGALSGLSLDGERFFYDNPLESRGGHHRWAWHRCPCCPPNLARLIASLGSLHYGVGEMTRCRASLRRASDADLIDGRTASPVVQHTAYPGMVKSRSASDFDADSCRYRSPAYPGWCNDQPSITERRESSISRR